jgi:hypothetical protein
MAFTVAPPVGTPVMFYEFADMKSEPKAAVVLKTLPRGILRLGLYDPHGGDAIIKPCVPHADDSGLRDDRGFATTNAVLNGAWDYHPWIRPGEDATPVQNGKARDALIPPKMSPDTLPWSEVEVKVLDLMQKHDGNFDEVFKRARQMGVTRDKLEALFVKHGKLAGA